MTEKNISFFEKNSKPILYLALILCVIISCLLFNLKISESGDDSDYIEGAWNFMKGFSFPTWHGSFYQIFLSTFIRLFGLNIIFLKFLSLILITFHLYWLFITFKNKIPSYILLLTVVFLSINANILIYSSLTYSEALYFVLQIICIYYVFKIIEKLDQNIPLIKLWKEWFILGFFMFLLAITRNIGISMVVSTVILFLIYRNWIASLFAVIPYAVYQILFLIYKNLFWSFSKIGIEDQFSTMFLKNPYYPEIGTENFKGFIDRFFINTHNYISGHILSDFGIKLDISSSISIFITVIFVIVFLIALWRYNKKDKYLGFIGIYIFIALCATFISQQVFWNQGRLVLIYFPLIFIFLFSWLHETTSNSKNVIIKIIPFVIGIILTFLVLINTVTKIKENLPILSENLINDKYYGFSKDYKNYLKLSEWCSENLPKEAVIGCRKPSLSFIYGNGREFKGIYQFPAYQLDSFLNVAKKMSSILLVRLDEINSKLSIENQLIFKQNLWAIILKPTCKLGIILLDSTNKDNLLSKVYQFKLLHTCSFDTLKILAKLKESLVVYPDSLLDKLYSERFDYIIDARINVEIGHGNKPISSTLKRYIILINQKYPSLFELVRVEGKSDPANLIKIHWEKIKKKKTKI